MTPPTTVRALLVSASLHQALAYTASPDSTNRRRCLQATVWKPWHPRHPTVTTKAALSESNSCQRAPRQPCPICSTMDALVRRPSWRHGNRGVTKVTSARQRSDLHLRATNIMRAVKRTLKRSARCGSVPSFRCGTHGLRYPNLAAAAHQALVLLSKFDSGEAILGV